MVPLIALILLIGSTRGHYSLGWNHRSTYYSIASGPRKRDSTTLMPGARGTGRIGADRCRKMNPFTLAAVKFARLPNLPLIAAGPEASRRFVEFFTTKV